LFAIINPLVTIPFSLLGRADDVMSSQADVFPGTAEISRDGPRRIPLAVDKAEGAKMAPDGRV
jgi:hypothetical protein